MSKRLIEEEINDINVLARKIGLDLRIASLCICEDYIKRVFELQEKMREGSNTYLYLKHIAPKERRKEYEAAIKHKEELAAYLYDSGQLEALATLRKVEIKENEPGAKEHIKKKKQYLLEELENMFFISKTRKEEIVNILLEYLQGKHSEHCEDKPGSFYKQVRKQIAEGKDIPIIKSKY